MRAADDFYQRTAVKLRALAHPVRLKLVEDLMRKKCCVGEIQKGLSVSQPGVSQHLSVLKDAGVVEGKREKNKICYKVTDNAAKRIIKILLKGDASNGKR